MKNITKAKDVKARGKVKNEKHSSLPLPLDSNKGMTKKKKQKQKEMPIPEPALGKKNNAVPDSEETTNSMQYDGNLKTFCMQYKAHLDPLVKAGVRWYDQLADEKEILGFVSYGVVKQLKTIAARILQDDIDAFNSAKQKGRGKREAQFRKTIMKHGTVKDKQAALVLQCMESPVHSLYHLNSLISMVSPKVHTQMVEIFDSVSELLSSVLLPGGRAAQQFESHCFASLIPLIIGNRMDAERQLLLWYFEDQLRQSFQKLVNELNNIAHSSIESIKLKSIHCLIKLVSAHPYQDAEHTVETVVNKLGDPTRKVASQSLFSLKKLLQVRPQLKMVVVQLVKELLFRANVTVKLQYYCLCCLKDILFANDETDATLAENLTKLYFGFFKACAKKGEVDTRLMAAILRGLNRAFSYIKSGSSFLTEQIDMLYKISHLVNFVVRTQALQLIYQVLGSEENQISDRFYQVLYKQIQDPSFGNAATTAAFLNLVYKSLHRDSMQQRIRAFIKRLLQNCFYMNCNIACGILYLISEVLRDKPELLKVERANLAIQLQEDDSDTEYYPDAALEDCEESEELVSSHLNWKREGHLIGETDCKDEVIEDSKDDIKASILPVQPSWVHRINLSNSVHKHVVNYNPCLRNPLYCGAQYSLFWELECLKCHYHPTVSLFASKIINGDAIKYSGDPLQDFTVMRFLNRFVYKNPKTPSKQRDSKPFDWKKYSPKGVKKILVDDPAYIKVQENKIPEDEIFVYKYFKEYKAANAHPDDKDETESISDDEFDDYLMRVHGIGRHMDEDVDFASGARATRKTHTGSESDSELDSDEEEEEVESKSSSKTKRKKTEKPHLKDVSDDDDDAWHSYSDSATGEDDDHDSDELGFNEEEVEFSDDDDFDTKPTKQSKKRKLNLLKGSKLPAKKKGRDDSIFADADDFAQLMEENLKTNKWAGTAHALSNKDESHPKQLLWEMQQLDDWRERKFSGRGHSSFHRQGRGIGKGKGRVQNRGFKKARGRGRGAWKASRKQMASLRR